MQAAQLSNGSIIRFHDLPGVGRPLLFLHGLGCASSCDYPSVVRCAPLLGRRVILVDLLGFGFSDRPSAFSYTIDEHAQVVCELVAHLKLAEFDLYGHSMGGSVAIALATMCAPNVCNLVLSEPNLDPGGGEFSRSIYSHSEDEYIRYSHARNVQASVDSGNRIWSGSMSVACPLAVYRSAASLIHGSTPSWRQQLLNLALHRTVIFGEYSLPDKDFERLPESQVEVAVVPMAGHSMASENPDGLASAIAAACTA